MRATCDSVDVAVREGSGVELDFKHGLGERSVMVLVKGRVVTAISIKAAGNGIKVFVERPERYGDSVLGAPDEVMVLHYSLRPPVRR